MQQKGFHQALYLVFIDLYMGNRDNREASGDSREKKISVYSYLSTDHFHFCIPMQLTFFLQVSRNLGLKNQILEYIL